MKLFASSRSPFARKVLGCAFRIGLGERIDVVAGGAADPAVKTYNPLGKIPVLVDDTGFAHVDSRVICEYLDGLHDREKLFPLEPLRRRSALVHQALADGMCDALSTLHHERERPSELRWASRIAFQADKVQDVVNWFERDVAELGRRVDIGTISLACALGYLDLRAASLGLMWRESCPRLAAWYDAFAQRPFMVSATAAQLRQREAPRL